MEGEKMRKGLYEDFATPFFLCLLLESSLRDFLWLNSLITLICNNVISNYNPDIFLSKARGEEGLVVRDDILTCLYPKKG